MEEFGSTLTNLPESRHLEALAFANEWLAAHTQQGEHNESGA
jgi:hypothetical protein